MKLVQLSFHFEYADRIETLLDEHQVAHFIRHPRVQVLDADGRQYGSKVFPDHMMAIQARVDDERVEKLLEDLKAFRQDKTSHEHLEAVVIPIENWIGPDRSQ
ncbi:MAG: hypothetical protein RQ722_07935 [Desulfuromonadales bacterium]|nr:hypothetical protein [Desulfuromonadales bacterium]MDT8444207.1 hypothetical protein [Desulfuromonadales bacterium]